MKKSLTSIWAKFKEAIKLSETWDDLDYVEERLLKTKKINRRLKKNRDLSLVALSEISKKRRELINNGEQPF